jgi:hypothetical protein
MRKRWLAPLALGVFALSGLALSGAVTLAPAAAPAAGPPVTVTDPGGDNQTAPDVTSLAIRQEGDHIVCEITLADRTNRLETGEFIVFFVDSDANRATGNKDGADYIVEFEQTATQSFFRIYRWSAAKSKFDFDTGFNPSFGTDWGRLASPSGMLRIFFKPKLFGIGAKFNLFARSESAGEGDNFTFDRVPDSGSLTFVLADTTAPAVKALPGAAKVGKIAKLNFRVSDASGQAREVVTVRRGVKTLVTVRTKLHPAVAGKTYSAAWKVPAKTKGALQFCVKAFDAAGNASPASCARLTVR